MTFGSCRFLFHQFIQRDKPHQIVADLNRLPAFAAALVRRTDVNELPQKNGTIIKTWERYDSLN